MTNNQCSMTNVVAVGRSCCLLPLLFLLPLPFLLPVAFAVPVACRQKYRSIFSLTCAGAGAYE